MNVFEVDKSKYSQRGKDNYNLLHIMYIIYSYTYPKTEID